MKPLEQPLPIVTCGYCHQPMRFAKVKGHVYFIPHNNDTYLLEYECDTPDCGNVIVAESY